MPASKYAALSSSSQRIAPVPRVCQAYARCATPLNVNNHPKRTVTAIPAIGGMMMARLPAMIITTLSAITHPKDFLNSADGASVVVLIVNSSLDTKIPYRGAPIMVPTTDLTIADSPLIASARWRYNNEHTLAIVHNSQQRWTF